MRGVSRTALKVAKGVVFFGHFPEYAAVLPEGAAAWSERLLRAAGLLPDWEAVALASDWYRRLSEWIERGFDADYLMHIPRRKRFFDDETRRALAAGATQVLAVGAGFDTLCPRLAAAYPGVTFVETDHPATNQAKRRACEALGCLRENLHLAGVDLAEVPLRDALEETGVWDPGARSAVLAEGVLIYLDEADVSAFLRAVADLSGARSRLLFSYVGLDREGRPSLGGGVLGALTRHSLRLIGEPLRWGVDPGDLAGFLKRHGYVDRSHPPRRDDLEYMAIADTG